MIATHGQNVAAIVQLAQQGDRLAQVQLQLMSERGLIPGMNTLPPVRLASARGGFDNTPLTERGIRGVFFEQQELAFETSWASMIGLRIDSDSEIERHRWLGAAPQLRQWIGGLLKKGVRNKGILIENLDFEATLAISMHDKRRDKTGQLVRKAGDLGTNSAKHWEQLLVNLWALNPLGYDQLPFFSAAHVDGLSGTHSNEVAAATLPALGGLADPTRPTKAEMETVLSQMAAHFFTYKDDTGQPANQAARQFLVLVTPAAYPGAQAAVNDALVRQGGTNELSSLGWNFTVVPEPRLTATSQVVMFRMDAATSPAFILQSEVDPTIKVLDENSEHAFHNNEVLMSLRTTRNVGPGEWRRGMRGTLSV